MSKPRPSKSGSKSGSKDRGARRQASTQPVNALSVDARNALVHAITLSSQYPVGSKLARDTLIRCLVEIIETHGTNICFPIVRDPSLDQNDSENRVSSIFSALGILGKLREAKQLMREMRMPELDRAQIYHIMGRSTNRPETVTTVLRELLNLSESTSSRETRLYVQFAIFSISYDQESALPPSLERFLEECRQKPSELTRFELNLLMDIAPLHPSCQLFAFLYFAMERVTNRIDRQAHTNELFRISRRMPREYLLELADAVHGSSYESRVRELAQNARTMEEMVHLEREDTDP